MLAAGERAPDFELPDLEGRPHRLSDALARGPVLALFWKPACATCDLAFPYYQRLVDAYGGEGWRLFSVSQDGAEESGEFVRRYDLTFPTLIEGDGWPVSNLYDPDATPTLFLIAPDGTVEMTGVGFHKQELNEIAARLAKHLRVSPKVVAEEDDGNPSFKPG